MELDNFKIDNIRKVIFLILFFVFLLFGLEALAVHCDLTGWNNEDCTVDIYYEDPSGGSDLDGCEWKVGNTNTMPSNCSDVTSWDTACSCSGSTYTCYDKNISIWPTGDCNTNGEGACKICSKATDGAGNTGYGGLSLNIDYQSPETAIECNGTTCSAGWYNADISITLFCSDSDSGCDKTYYCIDQTNSCSPGTLYMGAFNLTAEGTNYVRYYSTDIAGNVEPTNSKTIKLDKTGPISQFTDVATPLAGSTVITDFDVSVDDWDRPLGVTGIDNSGLANCYYSVYDSRVGYTKSGKTRNCSSDLSFTVTVSPTGDCRTIGGTCTVYVYAYDAAGNPGDGQSRTFNISEAIPPTVWVIGAPASWQNTNATASVGCSDADSGCDAGSYRLKTYTSAGACSPVYSDYTLTSPKTISSHLWVCTAAKDLAGNTGFSPTRVEFKVDKEKPTSTITSPPADSTQTADFLVSVSDTDTGGSGLGTCYYRTYDSVVGWTRGSTTRTCNSSQLITIGPTADCRTIGGSCTVYVYSYDNAGNQSDINIRSFTIAEPGFVCNISVPTTGAIDQWIEINVSGSQGAIASVKFSSDNNLNGFPDSSWDGPYDWNISSGNWSATTKTMKWSFAATGNYEVWAEVKDGLDQYSQCYDTIIIMECWPGQEDTCISDPWGCTHTIRCTPQGTWPDCPEDECTLGATQDCGINGTQTCTDACTWGTCVEPPSEGECSWPPPSCPTCQHPECDTGIGEWECQPDLAGTDCGDCQECDSAGLCGYIQEICEICVADSCISCSDYYDGSCGYGYCGSLEMPIWSYSGETCQYSCQYDASCEEVGECQRDYPDVVLSPLFQPGRAGDTLTYEVSVINRDSNCDPSTFSLSTGEYCNQPGWTCSLDLNSLTIDAGQSDLTTLWVTSPSNASKGNYDILVTAQNTGFPEFFGTGYATYKVLNNPPSAINLSASPEGICFLIHPFVRLSWTFNDPDLVSGDYQSAREVEIFSDSGYTNLVNSIPEPDLSPGSTEYTPNTGLSFSTDYYWRVRVWDSEGALSDCGQPEGWCYPEQPSFHTEKEWPWPDFSVTPPTQRVHLKERVEFTDESTCYDGPCNLSPTVNYLWEFGDGGTISEQGNTSHVYLATGNYDVTLTITDEVGNCTSDPIAITVTLPLPEWMEIPPF